MEDPEYLFTAESISAQEKQIHRQQMAANGPCRLVLRERANDFYLEPQLR